MIAIIPSTLPDPLPSPRVRVTKMADKGTHPDGPHPINNGYTIVGHPVTFPPAVGAPWEIWRTERNGIKLPGIFTTSPIEAVLITTESPGTIVGDNAQPRPTYRVDTQNSVYKVEVLLDGAP